MPDGSERREARRFAMTLAVRVLSGGPESSELSTHTRDVSYRGLYFQAESHFEVGTKIDFVITLPHNGPPPHDVHIRCSGQIVRVDAASNGTSGVAAKIERYEFLPATANAA